MSTNDTTKNMIQRPKPKPDDLRLHFSVSLESSAGEIFKLEGAADLPHFYAPDQGCGNRCVDAFNVLVVRQYESAAYRHFNGRMMEWRRREAAELDGSAAGGRQAAPKQGTAEYVEVLQKLDPLPPRVIPSEWLAGEGVAVDPPVRKEPVSPVKPINGPAAPGKTARHSSDQAQPVLCAEAAVGGEKVRRAA